MPLQLRLCLPLLWYVLVVITNTSPGLSYPPLTSLLLSPLCPVQIVGLLLIATAYTSCM